MELKKLEEEEEKKARQQSLTLNFLHPFPDIVHRLRERTKFAFANIFISLKTLANFNNSEINKYIYYNETRENCFIIPKGGIRRIVRGWFCDLFEKDG